jgi:hypothetical protein
MTGQDLDREAREALKDERLSSEIRVRSTEKSISPRKYSMTMDEVREIDKKRRQAHQEEWAPIIDVMDS